MEDIALTGHGEAVDAPRTVAVARVLVESAAPSLAVGGVEVEGQVSTLVHGYDRAGPHEHRGVVDGRGHVGVPAALERLAAIEGIPGPRGERHPAVAGALVEDGGDEEVVAQEKGVVDAPQARISLVLPEQRSHRRRARLRR